MSQRRLKFLIMMAVVFIGLFAVEKLFLTEPPQTLSQKIAASDVMDFLQVAYDDDAALGADMATLDQTAETAMGDAKVFLHKTIMRKSLARFETAVMRSPNAPLERLHNYIIANMSAFMPECAQSIDPQIKTLTGLMVPPPMQTPPGHTPALYIYKLMADVILAAEAAQLPDPGDEKTPDKLAKFYSMTEIMTMKQQGMDGLAARIAQGAPTPQDNCTLLLVEAEALNFVPPHAYDDMLKGSVISGVRLRLSNGIITP